MRKGDIMSGSARPLTGRNWAESLNQAEAKLAQALDAVRQQQRLLDQYFQGAQTEPPPQNWAVALDQAWQRVQHLPAMLEKAGASVTEVETALADGEQTLRQWLNATAAARGKLANWLAGAVP